MAKKKSITGLRNGRDSKSKRLGFKIYENQTVIPGSIILRQRGSKFFAGKDICMGKDYSLIALKEGKLKINKKYNKTYINII